MTPTGVTLTLAALALLPAAADADTTYCVNKPACVQAGGVDSGTDGTALQNALAAANAQAGPDRVEIGAGDYYSASAVIGFRYLGLDDNPVTVVGAGRGATTLHGPVGEITNESTYAVLRFPNNNSTVSDLKIAVPDSDSGNISPDGLETGGAARRIDVVDSNVDAAPATRSSISLNDGGSVEDCTATGSGGSGSVGIVFSGTSSARDCVLTGSFHGVYANTGSGGASTTATATRLNVSATTDAAYSSVNASLAVTSSLLRAPLGAVVSAGANRSTLNVANSTVIGTGAATSGLRATTAQAGRPAIATVDSSIIRGFQHSLTTGGAAAGTNVWLSYSDYDPATKTTTGAGAATVDESTGNINADPLFVNAAAGDYRLAAGSPALDTANPTPLGAAADSPGLDGLPRPADGDGNGVAVPDIGAFERAAPPPPPPLTLPAPVDPPPVPPIVVVPDTVAPSIASAALSARRFVVGSASTATAAAKSPPKGTKVRFTLSEAATVTLRIEKVTKGRRSGKRCSTKARSGKRCTVFTKAGTLTRKLGAGKASVAFSGRIGRRALKPGSYRFVLQARDAARNASKARTLAFTVLRR